METIVRIESISMLHSLLGEPPPKHPLISVIHFSKLKDFDKAKVLTDVKVTSSFYAVTLKQLKSGTFHYGRKQFDFQEGSMFFSIPGQVGTLENPIFDECKYNWGLFFHSDLIHHSSLSSKISSYSFLNYSEDEALHLSEDEKMSLTSIIDSIQTELHRPIDKHTKNVLVSGIDLLLSHCNRYYDRQFITREKQNKTIVSAIDTYLSNYFS